MPENTILVTGGCGFIGTHVCRKLAAASLKVRVIDLATPQQAIPGIEYIQGDINNPLALGQALTGINAVYHFAGITSIVYCQQRSIETSETNLLSTIRLMEMVRAESIRQNCQIRIIYASSAAIYGEQSQRAAIGETTSTTCPNSIYGAQKLASEILIRAFCQKSEIRAIIFRFFNVYGPGQNPDSPYSGVISIFSDNLCKGLPLKLFGNGSAIRDFISVHDISQACLQALSLPQHHFSGQSVNIGTGTGISIRQLAEEMMEITGNSVPLIDAPPREADINYSLADISLAKTLLSWSPKYALKDGLAELLSVKANS